MDIGDQVGKDDLASSIELASSLIQQLGEAFAKFEAYRVASKDKVQWNDIENHFHQMESMLKKKYEDLKAKEKEFLEKESETRRVIAEREAVVTAKEKDLLDHIQDLKDAAVAAITKARANHMPESAEPANSIDGNENKVSSSLNDVNGPLHTKEEGYPHDVGENTEGLDVKANRYSGLIESCELMDAEGLLNFIMENQKDLSAVRNELSVALSSVTEPARLVLESLEGFFPSTKTTSPGNDTKQGGKGKDALNGLRQSCVVIMEALSAMLAKADSHVDNFLNREIKEQAKAIADQWMPKLAVEGNDAANGNQNSLEVEGFLRLLATFRIGSDFDQDELCKLVLAVAHRHRQATELCHSLALTQKMPGIIEALINKGKPIDAVHLIQAFELSDTFPPVPLLKAYLKDVRRNAQGKSGGDTSLQILNNTRELTALKTVVKCVKDYKLQADYPLAPLETRIAQLLKSKANDKKRMNGELARYQHVHQHQQSKKARTNGGFLKHHPHNVGRAGSINRQTQISYVTERTSAYAEVPERYPHAAASTYSYPVASQAASEIAERYPHAAASTYSYPVASQAASEMAERYPSHATVSSYNYPVANQTAYVTPLGNDQKALYYQLDDVRTSAGYASNVPTYASYASSGLHTSHTHQPYM